MEFLTPFLFYSIYFFGVGACVGSFLNVVIYRVPKGESIVRPGSRCGSCGKPVKPWNNIPIVSYILLGGRCAKCGKKYSARYMAVEFITAVLFTACFVKFGLTVDAVIYMALTASLVAVTFIDLDHMIIPDSITLPGIPLGFLSSWFFLPTTPQDAFLAFLIGGGFFYLIAVLVPHGMGGGDIKLVAMLGAFLGLKAVFITIFLGSVIGSIGGGIGIAFAGKGRASKIPFGPYLVAGALIAVFWERELINLYLDIFVF